MSTPTTRQSLAREDAAHLYRLMRPAPVEPMASPCLPGFMQKRQAT